jgi:alpha-mannosidase
MPCRKSERRVRKSEEQRNQTITDIKAKTLDMIGNAHLDPVWLWTWQEGFAEAKATFRSALDRMRESDDFLFTSSSAALYEWIEINDPAMFAEIRDRVREGRWEITGGWWIQPDCNIPSGESFVRQGLYGQRYFKEKFGVTATVGYNVDSFGHAASLPQILLKSGMPSYVFMRPHPHEKYLPSRLFWWESDDGSSVLTFRIPYEYCTWGKELDQHIERCAAEFKGSTDRLMCFYGVGNHGGGPTRENIESIHRLQSDPALPTLVFSTPSRYFAAVRAEEHPIPTVHDELQHHASGCYAAHSGIKRWNRQAENALVRAETISALATAITGLAYPPDFERAWKGVLFNQFHDILAGTSIEPAYEDAQYLSGEAMAIASRNLNNGVQALSWRVNIEAEEGTRPIVVVNPHSWPVRDIVELETGRLPDDAVLLDASGSQTPFQTVRSYATVSSGSRNRVAFLADVPPLGYTTYRLASRPSSGSHQTVTGDDTSLENSLFRLEINPETGCISALHDKRLNFQWLRREGAKPVVLRDTSDTWSHGVLSYNDVAGSFTPVRCRLVEHGPVKAVLRVESAYNRSHLVQEFTMYADMERIDVHVTVDWHEQFSMLKLSFPLAMHFTTATYELPYGVIQRPANGEEEPGQRWVDMTGIGRNDGRRLGMSILNDGKYSFDMKEYEINLTVLRSPIYAHHVPYEPQPDREYTFTDQGVQRFTYSLLPHLGSWETARTPNQAAQLNSPLVPQVESFHPGPLPLRAGYIAIDTPNVLVTALKKAEDSDALILRAFEATNSATTATIELSQWNRTINTTFGPNEIKTFLIPLDADLPVRETNLLEWEQ